MAFLNLASYETLAPSNMFYFQASVSCPCSQLLPFPRKLY